MAADSILVYDHTNGSPPNYIVASGGTSAAAPLFAGWMALVNQQCALNGSGPIGFANPTIYSIGLNPGPLQRGL